MARRSRVRVDIDENSNISEIKQAFKELSKHEVHVGMSGDAELAMIAAVHEYGSTKMGIPARSFIGVTRKRSTSPIRKLVKVKLQQVAEGHVTPDALLEEIGAIGLEKLHNRFDKIRKPALSPEYAAEKGNKKILVRDDDLRQSLKYTIVQKGSGGS